MQGQRDSPLDCLLPLMKAKGVDVSPEEFHARVNLAFHNSESAVYDEIHRSMWTSLPQQFALLCGDFLEQAEQRPANMVALDIGCGTGLASELLLRTAVGKSISRIDLLDPSPQMLDRCARRASTWGVDYRLLEGMVETLPVVACYDLIVVCSVLHHIPDLPAFIRNIRKLQPSGAILLHVQDPNGDYLQDLELVQRCEELHSATQGRLGTWLRRSRLSKIPRAIKHRVVRPRLDYIDSVNSSLLASEVIRRPMTAAEIWSVTDIHVDGLPFSAGHGVSVEVLKENLIDYRLLSLRSYAFFGQLASELPPAFENQEQLLIDQRAPNGRYIGGVWQRGAE